MEFLSEQSQESRESFGRKVDEPLRKKFLRLAGRRGGNFSVERIVIEFGDGGGEEGRSGVREAKST